jgi:hypothetical protein
MTSAAHPSQYVSDEPMISSEVPCARIPDCSENTSVATSRASHRTRYAPLRRLPAVVSSSTPGHASTRSTQGAFPARRIPSVTSFPAVQFNKVYPSRHAHSLRTQLRAARDKPYSLAIMSIGAPLHLGHWSRSPGAKEWKGPDLYTFNIAGPFGALQGELHWTLHTYVRLHHFAYSAFQEHDAKLDIYAASLKAEKTIAFEDFEKYETEMIWKSRKMDLLLAEDIDLERSVQTINRMFVVALWALAEQYLGKAFQKSVSLRTGVAVESIKAPYRWDTFQTEFLPEGIVLENLHDYALANECRVLNNHIKHSPVISSKLAEFPPFDGHLGEPLERAVIDPQRYLNGVSNFLGSLIERGNAIHGNAG